MEGPPIRPKPETDLANLAEPEAKNEDSKDRKTRRRKKHAGSQALHSAERAEAPTLKPVEPLRRRSWFESVAEQTAIGENPKARLDKTESAPEEDVPMDKLGDKEKKVIAQVTGEAELKNLPPLNPDEPISAEAVPDLAAEEFWQGLAKTGDPDLALETVAAMLEIEPDRIAELKSELENEAAPEPSTLVDQEDEPTAERADNEEPDEAEPEPAASSSPPPSGSLPLHQGGSSGGGWNVPLHTFGGGGGPTGYNPNLTPAATPKAAAYEAAYDDGNPAVAALIGGIIGYLIGRRRGRIKTEKKLLPIQKKLSAEVVDLQWQLKAKETKIRLLAAEQVRQRPTIVERLARPIREQIKSEKADNLRTERGQEAHLLHLEKKAPERIGRVVIGAEAIDRLSASRPETAKADLTTEIEKEKLNLLPGQKQVINLNRAELLAISAKIEIDGSTLKQIYDTHLIGERGLRRLVAEHLKGGDLKKALRQEIVEREIDFERDPALRDMGAVTDQQLAASPSAPSSAALNKLLERADASMPAITISEEAAFYKARADYQARAHEHQRQQRRLVDISLISIVATLLTLALIVYLSRH